MGKKTMVWSLLVLGMTMFLMANSSSPSSASASSPNDISCQDAVAKLLPCLTFLKGSPPPTPSIGCCVGAQEVFQQATTTQIRRNLCECFKKAAIGYSIDPARAKLIPQLCKLELSVPIDPNIDCNRISF